MDMAERLAAPFELFRQGEEYSTWYFLQAMTMLAGGLLWAYVEISEGGTLVAAMQPTMWLLLIAVGVEFLFPLTRPNSLGRLWAERTQQLLLYATVIVEFGTLYTLAVISSYGSVSTLTKENPFLVIAPFVCVLCLLPSRRWLRAMK